MARGRAHWTALRRAVFARLDADDADAERWQDVVAPSLVPQADVEMTLPAQVGDYTDFYASLFHATNVGRMMRPDNPLLPNYKYIPIGYHGRASSLVVSGTPVRRPLGQTRPGGADAPSFGPIAECWTTNSRWACSSARATSSVRPSRTRRSSGTCSGFAW